VEQLELTAKTYDDAVAEALEKLDRDEDEVEIEVLAEIPGETVTIRVSVLPNPIDDALDWLEDLLDAMGVPCEAVAYLDEDAVTLDLETDEDAGMIIGRKGHTLDAIQYLLNAAFGQAVGKRMIVDIQGYRERHEAKLVSQAHEAAERVRMNGRPFRLPPMSASDRRIVHNALLDYTDLETGSQGEDPNRFVVISPKRGRGRRPAYRPDRDRAMPPAP
jgi:spoIIIJ-associated protein